VRGVRGTRRGVSLAWWLERQVARIDLQPTASTLEVWMTSACAAWPTPNWSRPVGAAHSNHTALSVPACRHAAVEAWAQPTGCPRSRGDDHRPVTPNQARTKPPPRTPNCPFDAVGVSESTAWQSYVRCARNAKSPDGGPRS